jgi:glycosyltransferase involved in cell wall biosynthesis
VKLLFVTHRYGAEIAGGAEVAVRALARRLVGRGHDVTVATTCAIDYVTWANAHPPGESVDEGVVVHRLPVARTRDPDRFDALSDRVLNGRVPGPVHVQREWMEAQGPIAPDLPDWLDGHAGSFAAAVFSPYLYWTTWRGLPAAGRRTATVLVPAAHDERVLRLQVFDEAVRHADALALYTPEEAALVRHRFRLPRPTAEIGLGLDDVPRTPDVDGFRARFGLGERPYLVTLGRVDVSKGAVELAEFFAEFRRRHPAPLALVLVGEPVSDLPADLVASGDIVVTGVVDEATKHAALAGAELLVQPSYFESFSLALCEGWLHERAALVQGRCAVLDGHVRRSGGGIPYAGYPEFEAALEQLLAEPALCRVLGRRGRAYVLDRYRWDRVLDRTERLLELVAS